MKHTKTSALHAEFIAAYPDTDNTELADRFGWSVKYCRGLAYLKGVHKSAEYNAKNKGRGAMKARQAAALKRLEDGRPKDRITKVAGGIRHTCL